MSFGRGRNKQAFCSVRSGPETPKLAGDNKEANDFGLVVAAVVTPLALSLSKQLANSRQALGLEPVEQPSDDGCYENGKAWILEHGWFWQIPGSWRRGSFLSVLGTCARDVQHWAMDIHERLAHHLAKTPDVAKAFFIAANATVIGDVTLGAKTSVWYGAVLRGDINSIEIGEGSNIQDLAVVHLADDLGVKIGRYCTIGHSAIIHACEVGDECLIGMGATILDGAKIGDRCIVGANALVTQRFVAPPGSMILGSPAKVVRPLTDAEKNGLRPWAEKYIPTATAHAKLAKSGVYFSKTEKV